MKHVYLYLFLMIVLLIQVKCQQSDKDEHDIEENLPPPPPPPPPGPSPTIKVTTIYKTVVFTSSSSPLPTIYNVTYTDSDHQIQSTVSNVSGQVDHGDGFNVALIISLVGGTFIVIAFFIVIKRKKAKRATHNGQEPPLLERRHMLSQTTVVVPSAPPAKDFLDQEYCAPELPPPAYAPSAPPAYLLSPIRRKSLGE